RVPHLVVDIRDGVAMVGPLVPPAGSPCLNCVDLHRQDRDPAWPALAAQLATGPESPPLCSITTLLSAGADTVDQGPGQPDGGTPQPIGTPIEISGPGRERRRTWLPHPACDCVRRRRRASPRTSTGSQSQRDEVQ